jgi:hypothetical protein
MSPKEECLGEKEEAAESQRQIILLMKPIDILRNKPARTKAPALDALDRGVKYEIKFTSMERERDDGQCKASVVYTYTISDGKTTTHAEVILSDEGLEIIEQRGKDPKTAAWMSLARVLKEGRDPFETSIILRIPFGHAEHFSKHGNYQSLSAITD